MAPVNTKSLVIDTDVAQRFGGDDAVADSAQCCRDFLHAMLFDSLHCAAFSPELERQWNKHQSPAARRWRTRMERRGRVRVVEPETSPDFRRHILSALDNKAERDAAKGDFLLIETARAADQMVVSCDATVRKVYAKASGEVVRLQKIVWVNPEKEEEGAVTWVKSGAKREKRRTLAAFRSSESR